MSNLITINTDITRDEEISLLEHLRDKRLDRIRKELCALINDIREEINNYGKGEINSNTLKDKILFSLETLETNEKIYLENKKLFEREIRSIINDTKILDELGTSEVNEKFIDDEIPF